MRFHLQSMPQIPEQVRNVMLLRCMLSYTSQKMFWVSWALDEQTCETGQCMKVCGGLEKGAKGTHQPCP